MCLKSISMQHFMSTFLIASKASYVVCNDHHSVFVANFGSFQAILTHHICIVCAAWTAGQTSNGLLEACKAMGGKTKKSRRKQMF